MTYFIIVILFTLLLTLVINKLVIIKKDWLKQYLPTLICFIFLGIVWLLNIGVLGEQSFIGILLLSLFGGLTITGILTWKFIQVGFDWLWNLLPKKKI